VKVHNAETYLFLVFSLSTSVLSIISVVMFVQLAVAGSLKVNIINYSDKDEKDVDIELQEIRAVDEDLLRNSTINPLIMDADVEATNVEQAVVESSTDTDPAAEVPPEQPESEPESAITVDEIPEEIETDERGIDFSTKVQYADETLNILKEQLTKKGFACHLFLRVEKLIVFCLHSPGESPLEYIPLPALKAELEKIFTKANNGEWIRMLSITILICYLQASHTMRPASTISSCVWTSTRNTSERKKRRPSGGAPRWTSTPRSVSRP
jgi:hypothetical protein